MCSIETCQRLGRWGMWWEVSPDTHRADTDKRCYLKLSEVMQREHRKGEGPLGPMKLSLGIWWVHSRQTTGRNTLWPHIQGSLSTRLQPDKGAEKGFYLMPDGWLKSVSQQQVKESPWDAERKWGWYLISSTYFNSGHSRRERKEEIIRGICIGKEVIPM